MAADSCRQPLVSLRYACMVCGVLALLLEGTSAYIHLSYCKGKKIGILDLSELAKQHGEVTCEVEEQVLVDRGTGVVYLSNATQTWPNMVPHEYGTHSMPFYLYKAIKRSKLYTPDLDEADFVFVYHYCYYIWWLAHVHTLGKPHWTDYTPGTPLVAMLEKVIELPRWKKNGGRDFVFYDSHPGFVDGAAANPFLDLNCGALKNSIHFVSEHGQKSWCKDFKQMRVVSTPYTPNCPIMAAPLAEWDKVPRGLTGRDTLLFSSTKCMPYDDGNVGKKMRYELAVAFNSSANDVAVSCTDLPLGKHGGQHVPFQQMLDMMGRSRFCITIPGDAASTRRLGEIYMAGCIPVFIGPPYNTAPLSNVYDYTLSSLWFNVSEYRSWLPREFKWSFGPQGCQEEPWGQHYWFPEAVIPPDHMYQVEKLEDVLAVLRAIPEERVKALLIRVAEQRPLFGFRKTLGRKLSAVSAIAATICQGAEGPNVTAWRTAYADNHPGRTALL